MRGVVSLATALSIPLLIDGTAFPHRNLIIFITFVVIFITLVVQGLTLPFIIKLIKLKEIDQIARSEEQQTGIQLKLDELALAVINQHHLDKIKENELIGFYKDGLESSVIEGRRQLASLECNETEIEEIHVYQHVLLGIYAKQRKELFKLRKEKFFSDEEIRKAELQLDLNELKITGAGH
ncbi:Sodium, potassium, lithium and rubidium/H(+) antiporter [compost metagenome]